MQTAAQAQTTTGPRTKIYSGIRTISFVALRGPNEGVVTQVPQAVLTTALRLLASGSAELARNLIQQATKCSQDTAEDVIEFILEMVKPTPPKSFVIDDDHKLRASKVMESALRDLMPKEPVKAADALNELLDSIFKSIR